jgi:hypothetical protein
MHTNVHSPCVSFVLLFFSLIRGLYVGPKTPYFSPFPRPAKFTPYGLFLALFFPFIYFTFLT